MSVSGIAVQTCTAEAARGAGVPAAQSALFGRASVWHVALAQDIAPLQAALENVSDSPILRLPLLIDDIQRAAEIAGPDISLSFHAADAGLLPAYLRLLPRTPAEHDIILRDQAPPQLRLRLGTAPANADDLPARLALPGAFLSQLRKLGARRLVPASDRSRKGAGA